MPTLSVSRGAAVAAATCNAMATAKLQPRQ